MKTADDLRAMVRDRSADLLKRSGELMDRMPVVVERRTRPMWQTAAMWFAAGMAIAASLGFFFDRQRGAARRRMAVDRTVATARDLRNKAAGTVAEIKGSTGDAESRPPRTAGPY